MRDMTAIRVMHVMARASRIIRPTVSGFISYCDLSFVNSSITTISQQPDSNIVHRSIDVYIMLADFPR